MANPQAENGHVDIANDVMEHLAQVNLCPYEWRLLVAVLRKTWGWKKKMDYIAPSQLAKMTGIKRQHVCRARAGLISKGLLLSENGKIGPNKDYETWFVTSAGNESAKSGQKRSNVTDTGNGSVTGTGNDVTGTGYKTLPVQGHTKEKKDTDPNKVGFEDFWKLFKKLSPSEVGSKKNAKGKMANCNQEIQTRKNH
jgi:phage replication O-like protein O